MSTGGHDNNEAEETDKDILCGLVSCVKELSSAGVKKLSHEDQLGGYCNKQNVY